MQGAPRPLSFLLYCVEPWLETTTWNFNLPSILLPIPLPSWCYKDPLAGNTQPSVLSGKPLSGEKKSLNGWNPPGIVQGFVQDPQFVDYDYIKPGFET